MITSEEPDMSLLVKKLVHYCYPEISKNRIHISWDKQTKIMAYIVWTPLPLTPIQLFFNPLILKFEDPVLIGITAHELSHATGQLRDEGKTDEDVLERGLGVYLAVSRAITNVIEDYAPSDGSSPYLGYNTILERLDSAEEQLVGKILDEIIGFEIGVDLPLIMQFLDSFIEKKDEKMVITTEGSTKVLSK